MGLGNSYREKVAIVSLIFLLIFQSFAATLPGAIFAAGGEDKTSVFMGVNETFPLTVKQGEETISPNETIQGRQQITLTSGQLNVPVNGDDADPNNADPTNYIQQGDYVELTRTDNFPEIILPTVTKTLNAQTDTGQKKLGTAYFTPESIKIVFDGDESFFNGVGKGITFGFDTTADVDVSNMNYGEEKEISIFNDKYMLKNPEIEASYEMTLVSPGMVRWDQYSYRGIQAEQFVEGAVTWQSTVSAFDKHDRNIALPLDGKTFVTNPSTYNTSGNVKGVYVPGSFKVNGNQVEPTIAENGELTYVFPEETGKNPQVEYKTWIPKEGYYYEHRNPPGNLGRSYRVMRGSVELKESGVEDALAGATQEISFAPDWIQATGAYNHSEQEITWTVTVNKYNKTGLKDFTITNVLPEGLTFESATWKTWENGVEQDKGSITPDSNSVYSFGEVNGQVVLTIKSKVASGSEFRIDPRANWNLDTSGGIQNNDVTEGIRPVAVTDEAIITVGAHTFTKSGSVSMEDYNLGAVKWTVNVTPQYALPNGVVYDLLVHGGDLAVLDHAVDATNEVDAATIAKIKENVNEAQTWKQYDAGSLTGVTNADNLTLKAIPLTVDGEVVADLIKVTGFTSEAATSFSFRALEMNPDVLFRQDNSAHRARWNRALLFDGDAVKTAQNSINLHYRMLNKDMLFASQPLKQDGTPENFVVQDPRYYIQNDNNEAWTIAAYDQTTKEVTFRLGVNMPGYNTKEMAKSGGSRVITDVKLIDTLPEGWEFVPYAEGKDFELYQGYSHNGQGAGYGTTNTAQDVIEPGSENHVVSFTHEDNVGTFTFERLDGPYVILVKARPSNDALADYIDDYLTNGTKRQEVFNQADFHMTWGGVEKVVTEKRKVIVPVKVLGKSVTKPSPGVLEWTVDYYPPYNMEDMENVYLEDTLSKGMNLRKDPQGNPILTAPSVAVYEAELTSSGKLVTIGDAIDVTKENSDVTIDVEDGEDGKTVIKFNLDKPNNFYKIVYQTEVDATVAKAGDKISNEIKLSGDESLAGVSAESEATLDNSDVGGAGSSNAQLPIIKQDPDENPLDEVCFVLYEKDGTEVVNGVTANGGKLNLLFANPGSYDLKQTCIDEETYLPTTKIYDVYVGDTPGKPIWVDGVKVSTDNPLIVPTPIAGQLTVTNEVAGNAGDEGKEFTYTITFEGEGKDGTYKSKKGDETGEIKDGDTFTLKHGESINFPVLPKDLEYTITQTNYTEDGYTTEPKEFVHTGTIEGKGDHKADYVNTRNVGDVKISNEVVSPVAADEAKEFTYKVIFDGNVPEEGYTYKKSDGTDGKIKSGDTFTLTHEEDIVIKGLLKGVSYKVVQTDYTNENFETNPETFTYEGAIENVEETAHLKYVNTKEYYTFTFVSNGGTEVPPVKEVEKNEKVTEPEEPIKDHKDFGGWYKDEDLTEPWDFNTKITKDTTVYAKWTPKKYTVTYDKNGGDTDANPPTKVVNYNETVEEFPSTPPTREGYTFKGWGTTTDKTEEDFTTTTKITEDTRVYAIWEKIPIGGLKITNEVTGEAAEKDREFVYTIEFTGTGEAGLYNYEKSDASSGQIKNGDTIKLKDGESVTLPALPADLEYTITQTDYAVYGYETDPTKFVHTGTIEKDAEQLAPYVNTRYVGAVKVSNKVESPVAKDAEKYFTYTITFEGNVPTEGYSYEKSDGTTGLIKSGGKFTLQDDQTIRMIGLAKDVTYKIMQTDYTNEYFTTNPASFTYEGAIENVEETAHLKYVNTKEYYNFTFVSNGGTEVPPVKEIEKNEKVTEPKNPTKEHYEFDGWYKDEDLTEAWDFTTKITKDTTIYAKWTPKKYTVTYDKNGGDTDSNPPTQTVTYNESVEEFPSTPPTRKGYTFVGWGTTTDKTEEDFTTTTKITGDTKVYAIWEKLPAIKGVVTDNTKERNPIKDATVIVTKTLKDGTKFKEEVTTKADGKYEIPIPEDGNYDVEIIKPVEINGEKVPVSFKQKVGVGTEDLDKNETVPADKTFTGVILTKDKDHMQRLETSGGVAIKQLKNNTIAKDGASASVDESGVFTIENLTPDVPYEFAIVKEITVNGKTVELAMGTITVTLDQDGEIAIHEQLIDPYGIITDANTGKIIEGAKVELYYADTPRNRAKGLTPNQLVPQDDLGGIFDFAPNDNANHQMSTGNAEWSDEAQGFGNYAWMVPAEADYYIIATKDGYYDYDSRNDARESADYIIIDGQYFITVDYEIVNHDFKMRPLGATVDPEEPREPTQPEDPKEPTEPTEPNRPEDPGTKPIEQDDPVDIPVDLDDPKQPTVKLEGSSEDTKEQESDKEKLPKTATAMYNYVYAGFILLVIGAMFAMKFRRRENE